MSAEFKPSLCASLLCAPLRTSVSTSEKWEEKSLLCLPSRVPWSNPDKSAWPGSFGAGLEVGLWEECALWDPTDL